MIFLIHKQIRLIKHSNFTMEIILDPFFIPSDISLGERCIQVRNLVENNDYETAKDIINKYNLSDDSYFRSPRFLRSVFLSLASSNRYSLQRAKFYYENISNFDIRFIIVKLITHDVDINIISNSISTFNLDIYQLYYNHNYGREENILYYVIASLRTDIIEHICIQPPNNDYSDNFYNVIQNSYLRAIQQNPLHANKLIGMAHYILVYFPNTFNILYEFSNVKLFSIICSVGRPCAKLVTALLELLDVENVEVHQQHIYRLFQYYCGTESLADIKRFYSHYPYLDITNNNDEAFRCACSYNHLEIVQWLCELNPKYSYRIENGKTIPIVPINFPFIEFDNSESTCPICYMNQTNVKTNCNHEFCRECIETYYRKKIETNEIPACPCCRTKM